MRYLVGDVETDGFPPDARVVEIAWVEIDEDFNILDTKRSLIDSGRPIPAGASAVHGIVTADLAGAPAIEDFMSGFTDQDDDVVLVAHNAPFDVQFFGPHVPTLAGSICTLRLARDFYKDADNHKLQTLKYHLGLEADVAHHEAHTAMADTKVLLELLRHLHLTTGMDLNEMLAYCTKPRVITHMPFGKHKGKAMKDVPKSYLTWALGNMTNLDPELRAAFEGAL